MVIADIEFKLKHDLNEMQVKKKRIMLINNLWYDPRVMSLNPMRASELCA